MVDEKKLQVVRDLLIALGEDPDREGLKETPKRVVKSWGELYSGYTKDPAAVLKATFYDGACDELVILDNIDFYSTCEHHMLPFSGRVHVGYLPDKKVVGVSKLARLVEVYARRLQIQERMTTQIAESFMEIVQPRGIMVVVEARHFCMSSRGVRLAASVMRTSAVRGLFMEQEKLKSEFLSLIRRGEKL